MKEINLDNYLIDREREMTLGGKKIVVRPLSINRALQATKLYQDSQSMLKDKGDLDDLKFSKKYVSKLIDACVYIVRPIGFVNVLKSVFSGNSLSRKWIMNNCTVDQLEGFVNEVIMPLLGEKKNQTVKNQ